LGARAKVEERSDKIPPWQGKNRDEPINFIVRVIFKPGLKSSNVD